MQRAFGGRQQAGGDEQGAGGREQAAGGGQQAASQQAASQQAAGGGEQEGGSGDRLDAQTTNAYTQPLHMDRLDAQMIALRSAAPLDLRVNTLKTTLEEAIASLARAGLRASPTLYSPIGLRLEARGGLGGGIPLGTHLHIGAGDEYAYRGGGWICI